MIDHFGKIVMGTCISFLSHPVSSPSIQATVVTPTPINELVHKVSEDSVTPLEEEIKEDQVEELTTSQRHDLLASTSSVPFFSLAGRLLWAKVVSVYDGDTCHVVVFLTPTHLTKFKCRSYGIDCPEMKPSKSIPELERQSIKSRAEMARSRFIQLCGDQLVLIQCHTWDKYGRLMATFYQSSAHYDRQESINQVLIREGHAYEYLGGTKEDGWGV